MNNLEKHAAINFNNLVRFIMIVSCILTVDGHCCESQIPLCANFIE